MGQPGQRFLTSLDQVYREVGSAVCKYLIFYEIFKGIFNVQGVWNSPNVLFSIVFINTYT